MEKDFPRGIKASGADALRFALVASTQQSRQINLDLSNVTSAQHFANKLWNVSAFYRTRQNDAHHSSSVSAENVVAHGLTELRKSSPSSFSLAERFIMSRLADTVVKANAGMEKLEPSATTEVLRKFIIQDLCDVYVEFIKPTLFAGDEVSKEQKPRLFKVLQTCFDASLRMMHPFMPFVTEVTTVADLCFYMHAFPVQISRLLNSLLVIGTMAKNAARDRIRDNLYHDFVVPHKHGSRVLEGRGC